MAVSVSQCSLCIDYSPYNIVGGILSVYCVSLCGDVPTTINQELVCIYSVVSKTSVRFAVLQHGQKLNC